MMFGETVLGFFLFFFAVGVLFLGTFYHHAIYTVNSTFFLLHNFFLWHSVPGTLYDTFQAGCRSPLLEDKADPRKTRKYVALVHHRGKGNQLCIYHNRRQPGRTPTEKVQGAGKTHILSVTCSKIANNLKTPVGPTRAAFEMSESDWLFR